MTLDPRFICSSDLEGLFVDKDTALPLSAGVINFYEDSSRTVGKSVYQLSGSPPYSTASFTPLGDTITLNAAGSYQDGGGNEIVIYYFPYHCTVDGMPSTSTGVSELYYVTVFNSGGVQQFTREAWPPLASNLAPSPITTSNIMNYIPNGQFLYYNAKPITATVINTLHTNTSTLLAQGGWSFQQTQGSAGTYVLSFSPVPDGTVGLNDFPPNQVNVQCTSAGAEAVHDLVIQWPNVNTFSVESGVNNFTLTCAANSNTGATFVFQVVLTSYFGTGGSPTIESVLTGSITAAPGFTYQNVIVPFPNNSAYTIGPGNYVSLALRTPSGQTCNASFTDFSLVAGTNAPASFPTTTNAEMLSQGIAGWMPTPAVDGSDLYLPLVLTPTGMTFDHSIVGQIIGKTETKANAVNNELLMDGSVFVASGYSALGIPYSRLASYLAANSPAITIGSSTIPVGTTPLFGTGPNFVTILQNTDATKFDLSFNTASGSNTVNNQTSGFTHTSADPLYVFTVTGVPTAGEYFTFTPATGGGLVYNVWFTVNGSGTAPTAPTGANILVALVSADTVATTIVKILKAINQYQFMLIDARGYFWRGLDPGATTDPDAATRTIPGITDNASAATGAFLGSLEAQAFLNHTHNPTNITTFAGSTGASTPPAAGSGFGSASTTGTSSTGGSETRPVNLALNWFIRY